MTDYDFVKTIYSWFFPIDCYEVYHTITVEQYRKITGKDYTAASDPGSANAAQSANTAVSQA
ncbi:hypothetical protein ACLUX0_08155 [Limosilactobacillus mucosae]